MQFKFSLQLYSAVAKINNLKLTFIIIKIVQGYGNRKIYFLNYSLNQ